MSCDRLKEKLSDIETEDHILRQQALLNSQSRRMSGRFSVATQVMTPQKMYFMFLDFFGSFFLLIFYFLLQPSENGHQVNKRRATSIPCFCIIVALSPWMINE